jgi:hypothetical protein
MPGNKHGNLPASIGKMYEDIRDGLAAKGMPYDQAQSHAARIARAKGLGKGKAKSKVKKSKGKGGGKKRR